MGFVQKRPVIIFNSLKGSFQLVFWSWCSGPRQHRGAANPSDEIRLSGFCAAGGGYGREPGRSFGLLGPQNLILPVGDDRDRGSEDMEKLTVRQIDKKSEARHYVKIPEEVGVQVDVS